MGKYMELKDWQLTSLIVIGVILGLPWVIALLGWYFSLVFNTFSK